MANWKILKTAIANAIKANDNQEITGDALQSTLFNIVNSVGENATLAGIATPTTQVGIPDGPIFYFATQAGTYLNFGGVVLNSGLTVLYFDGDLWKYTKVYEAVQTTGSSTTQVMSQKAITDKLAEKVSTSDFNVELSKKANITDIEKHDNAYTEDYLNVPDFSKDKSIASLTGQERTDAIRALGNSWLDAITFNLDTDAKYIGRCKTGWDGINVECYNYICSWADHIGVQQLTGAVRIDDDGKVAPTTTTQNVLFRTYKDKAWGAWQSYDADLLADPARRISDINVNDLNDIKNDFYNIQWKARYPIIYRLIYTKSGYDFCIGTTMIWADASGTWIHELVVGSFGVNDDGSPSWMVGSGRDIFRIFHRGYAKNDTDWGAWQEVSGTGIINSINNLSIGFDNMSKAINSLTERVAKLESKV